MTSTAPARCCAAMWKPVGWAESRGGAFTITRRREPTGVGARPRGMKLIVLMIAVVLAVAGCGQSSSGGTTTADGSAVTGVFLKHPSTDPGAGTPVAGATIGVYTRRSPPPGR